MATSSRAVTNYASAKGKGYRSPNRGSQRDRAREDYEILQWCWENGHADFLDRCEKLAAYYENNQWDERAASVLRARGVPTLVIPKFFSTMNAISGKQLASRSDIRFVPQKDATANEARVMDKTYLYVAQQNFLDHVESTMFDRGTLFGRGYYDCRTEYDENYMGQCKIRARRSQQVVLEPDMESYDPDDWSQVFYVPWVNLLDVEYTYGADAADELEGQPTADFLTWEDRSRSELMFGANWRDIPSASVSGQRLVKAYRLVERQFREIRTKECFVDVETGDFSEIPETWDRNKIASVLRAVPVLAVDKRKVKTIRWRVTANNLVLHDEYSPYKRFTIVPYFPYFVDNSPMGHMENLLDMQDLTNKTFSKQLEILSTTANSGYKVKQNALKNMTVQQLELRGAESGIVLELDDISNLEKIQPNQVPTGFDRFGQIVDGMYDKASGVSNQTRGFAREDVAAKAIVQNDAANDINFAKMFDNLFFSKALLGRNILDCIQLDFTETRLLAITGGFANQNIEQFTINQPTPEGQLLNDVTRGSYSISVIPSKSRSTLEESEFDSVLELRKLGIAIPDNVMIEASPLTNKSEILQQMTQDSNQAAQQQQQQQAELHAATLELQKAQINKANADAQLSMARARKAENEANQDPNAKLAIEQERASAERASSEAGAALDAAKLKLDDIMDRRNHAMRLTEMGHERRMAQLAGPKKEKSNG